MAGGVQQGQRGLAAAVGGGQRQHRLLGKDRDAPRPLLTVRVQKGVTVVDAAQLAQHAGAVEQPFGQCGFAAVNMGQQADDETFHRCFPRAFQSCFYCTIFLAIWQTVWYSKAKFTGKESTRMRWQFGVVFQKKGNP